MPSNSSLEGHQSPSRLWDLFSQRVSNGGETTNPYAPMSYGIWKPTWFHHQFFLQAIKCRSFICPYDMEHMDGYGVFFWDESIRYYISLSIQVCPKKGINPTILLWGWDWDHQTYSREGYGSLGFYQHPPKLKECKLMLSNMNFLLDVGMYDYSNWKVDGTVPTYWFIRTLY